jgi:AraC-like DNA-binding protein
MASSMVLRISDPLAYQAAISSADLEFLPTAGGQFHGEMTKIRADHLWMDHFYRNLPSLVAGTIKPGRRVFTFVTSEAVTLRHCGMEVSSGDIMVNNFDEMHQRTEAEFHLGSMSLTPSQLDAACKTIVGREFSGSPLKHLVRPNAALMSRLLELHSIVAQIATTMPKLFEVPEAVRSLEQQLIHVLVRCLTEGVSLQMSDGGLRRYQIVSRFKEYLEAHPNKALYLPEMCAAVSASERTLRNACEEHLGMGPIRFLALRRMNLVRRALMQADAASSTVTAVATEHGFWELGRFSVAYRALFGEKPSTTLHRRPDARLSGPGSAPMRKEVDLSLALSRQGATTGSSPTLP